ncbi:MAG: methyltransferase domain-containing protein [Myxococcota bacterium]|jgi:predicted nicotinamide N-methyase|nr:methyltransferase domain-containing protein [Myxococcota bacterium]
MSTTTATASRRTAKASRKKARDSRTAFGLEILNSNHPEVRKLKREGNWPYIHGHKFWNSSFLIMNELRREPLPRGSRVLEIGCGWGLLGIYCAKNFDARVTGVDADRNVFPFLELHARRNGVEIETEVKRFERLTVERLRDFDVILGADICFWDELTPILFNLMRRAGKAGVKQVIIGDPSRSPFTDLANRCDETYRSARVVARSIARPVRAIGELLIVQP